MKCPLIRLLNLQYHSPQVLSGKMDTGCIINAPPSHGALQFIKHTHTQKIVWWVVLCSSLQMKKQAQKR